MKELLKEKEILYAIKNAIANMNLEEEYDLDFEKENIQELEEKVLKIGGYDDELGRLLHK